jgi:choline dehydrogenase-like flavoprotein
MHNDPRQGVVDANCRVHGLSNVYVAGSSVFPTGGYANPTLTLVALALRLADHLKAQPHLKAALPRANRAHPPVMGSLRV